MILDHIGARYLPRDLEALATDGRIVIIGSMGGEPTAEIDVTKLLYKRAQIIGSTLRGHGIQDKAAFVAAFLGRFGADLKRAASGPCSIPCSRSNARTKRTGSWKRASTSARSC